jgi:hypothetical protein
LTELGCPRHVRFASDSDRIADIVGPFRANNGHSDPKFAETILLKAHPKGPLNFKPDDRGSRGNQWL